MECCGRREMLTATGVVASGIVLSGCGGDSAEESAETAADAVDDATDAVEDATDAVGSVASTADVPVGGGTIIESAQVVLTQPTEGEFKAFSAVCPHQGCLVTDVRDGVIACPCHGSQFDIATGDVITGPASSGLEEKQVTVSGDGISVG